MVVGPLPIACDASQCSATAVVRDAEGCGIPPVGWLRVEVDVGVETGVESRILDFCSWPCAASALTGIAMEAVA